jgi:hypothetical protein
VQACLDDGEAVMKLARLFHWSHKEPFWHRHFQFKPFVPLELFVI